MMWSGVYHETLKHPSAPDEGSFEKIEFATPSAKHVEKGIKTRVPARPTAISG